MLEKYVSQVEREKNRIFNIARSKYCLKKETIEDLYQDTFLHLINDEIKSYDINRGFLPYFIKSFLNKCIDYLRKNQRKKRRGVEATIMFSEFEDIDTTNILAYKSLKDIADYEILRSGLSEDFLNDLKEIIDRLKPNYRDIIKMRYWDNMKYHEIAERLDIPIGTVKSRLLTAKKNLKNYWQKIPKL